MPRPLKDIRADASFQYYPPTFPVQALPAQTPKNVKATGKEGYILIQWTPHSDADGYEVFVSSDQNMAAPDQGVFTVAGGTSSRFSYDTGNIVLARYFAVRSFQGTGRSALSAVVTASSALTDSTTPTGAAEPEQPSPTLTQEEEEWARWH